jgi:hypothetical protein
MRNTARQTRENRTLTVDFQHETTDFQLLGDGKAFVECVLAFLLALSFQLAHKATCSGGRCLTRHSHYVRVRLGGVTLWRLQCTTCKAVFTVLPHCVLRYRSMRPEVTRDALLATHGGSVWHSARSSGISRRWRSIASSVRSCFLCCGGNASCPPLFQDGSCLLLHARLVGRMAKILDKYPLGCYVLS